MKRHGNQLEWALHCAVVLAGLDAGKRLSAGSLAELHGVPPKYLAKALQLLANAEIVNSAPGPKGGYCLAKSADEISVLDVVDAVEGGEPLFRCQEIRRRGPCQSIGAKHFAKSCQIADVMWRAEEAWRAELARVTLADIGQRVLTEVSVKVLGVVQDWVDAQTT